MEIFHVVLKKNPHEIEPHPVLIHPTQADTKNINEKSKRNKKIFYGIQDL